MSEMILTVGLPGCGKTYWATNYAQTNPGVVIVERDCIRHMMYGVYYGHPIDENEVTRVQTGLINSVFKRDGTVVVSDTNLNRSNVKSLVQLAQRWGATITFKYFDIDPMICISNDARRQILGQHHVGKDVILEKAKRYCKGNMVPRYEDLVQLGQNRVKYDFVNAFELPEAIIVDLDGTIAIHRRNPHDYDKLSTDIPNASIIEIVLHEYYHRNTHILFTSGRPDSHRGRTIDWINEHLGLDIRAGGRLKLFMRTAGDNRMDAVVKYELFDALIRKYYRVKWCLDDRRQVVDMWRSIGLTVLDVAGNDF